MTKKRPKARKVKPSRRSRGAHLRQSKSDNFLEYIRENNTMIDYITNCRIMNPAASANLNEPRREGGYVRLAHAREEFTAPVLTKGKSVQSRKKSSSKKSSRRNGSTSSKSKVR